MANWTNVVLEKSVLVVPNLNYPVAPPSHEPPHSASCALAFYPRLTRYQTSRLRSRRPTDSIDTLAMRREDLVCPVPLLEFQYRYLPV